MIKKIVFIILMLLSATCWGAEEATFIVIPINIGSNVDVPPMFGGGDGLRLAEFVVVNGPESVGELMAFYGISAETSAALLAKCQIPYRLVAQRLTPHVPFNRTLWSKIEKITDPVEFTRAMDNDRYHWITGVVVKENGRNALKLDENGKILPMFFNLLPNGGDDEEFWREKRETIKKCFAANDRIAIFAGRNIMGLSALNSLLVCRRCQLKE